MAGEDCTDLHRQLAELWKDGWDQPRPPIPDLSPSALAEDLKDTLNIRGLLEGDSVEPSLDARPLEVMTIAERAAQSLAHHPAPALSLD